LLLLFLLLSDNQYTISSTNNTTATTTVTVDITNNSYQENYPFILLSKEMILFILTGYYSNIKSYLSPTSVFNQF